MFTNPRRTSSVIALLLIWASIVSGQSIDQVHKHSQPNQWNNMLGRLTAKQATLWAGAPLQAQLETVSVAQMGGVATTNNTTAPIPAPTDAYGQYKQIGPTRVVHVGPATIQMGNQPPALAPPNHEANSVTPELVARLTQQKFPTTPTTSYPTTASPAGPPVDGPYPHGNSQINVGKTADRIVSRLPPSKSTTRAGIGKRTAGDLQAALRQLNPFTIRENHQGNLRSGHPVTTHNRNLFTAPVAQRPVATQFANSGGQLPPSTPVAKSPVGIPTSVVAMKHLVPASVSSVSPRTRPGMSVTKAATRAGFQSPPVLGTPLRVADARGVGTLPAPNEIQESPFTPSTESIPGPSELAAPVEQMLPPPMGQRRPSRPDNLPIGPAPQSFSVPFQQAPIPPQASGYVHQADVYGAVPCGPPRGQANVQVFAPHNFSDPLTQELAQRDLNSFIHGSVNGFCPPSPQCQSVVPCPPRNGRCGQEVCGDLCGCRTPCTSPIWFNWETLLYYLDGYDIPPVLTRSPVGTPPQDIGVIGIGTTETLFGGTTYGDGLRYGGRVSGGYWLDKRRTVGLQGELFALTNGGDDDFRTRFGGSSILARPFLNEVTGLQEAQILNLPGVSLGVFDANLSSRIYSAATALRFNLKCGETTGGLLNPCSVQSPTRLDFLLGYRYFHLGETLQLYGRSEPIAGNTSEFFDEYRPSNDFHGIELGFDWVRQRSRFYSQLTATVALGELDRETIINGNSILNGPGPFNVFSGGFYNNAAEQGRTSDRGFAVLPQARIKLGYCITPSLRVFAGYDVLYLSSAIRPGRLVNTQLDPADLLVDQPPANRLRRTLPDDEFWMQGVSFGAIWNF